MGKFEEGDFFVVKRVVGISAMIVEGRRKTTVKGRERSTIIHKDFLAVGISTTGIVDGATVKLGQTFKVASTHESLGAKMFLADVVPDGPKPKDVQEKDAAEAFRDAKQKLRAIAANFPDTPAGKEAAEMQKPKAAELLKPKK